MFAIFAWILAVMMAIAGFAIFIVLGSWMVNIHHDELVVPVSVGAFAAGV